ncbi:MAG: hypothetical protein IJW32_05690 [Clostridia bacterium]|nr:hypothetical protein [Clostridia bacterium]
MTEKELCDILIKNAFYYFNAQNTTFPSIVIDKNDYSDFNISELKKELNKENFDIIDGTLAPEPFAQMEEDFKAKKWFVYQLDNKEKK